MRAAEDDGETPPGPLVLVGLMGAGKSTVGKLVAASLGRTVVDIDAMIEQATGQTVGELWVQGGEAAYRPLEHQAVIDALERVPSVVLAAPAGVIDAPDLVARLAQPDVFVAFLRGEVETLAARIEAQAQERPLVGDDPAIVLRGQALDRNPRYETLSETTIDIGGRSADELAAMVLVAFRSRID